MKNLFVGDIALEPSDGAVGAFVAGGEGFAIGGEEPGFGEEAAEHRDDALVKGKDGAEGLCEVLLRGVCADGLLECLQGEEHFGQALLEHGEEQGEAVIEVNVEGRF